MSQKKRAYYVCFVPMCKNTTIKTPEKKFIFVPKDREKRRLWWLVARRELPVTDNPCYCCEDHLDLENDLANYMYVKMMGGKMILKEGVVPHKFACQGRLQPVNEYHKILARKRTIQEILQGKERISEIASTSMSEQSSNERMRIASSHVSLVKYKGEQVCHRYFEPEDVIWKTSMFSDRTGVTLNAKLKIPRLLYDPKKHPYGLSYLSSTVPSRESPDARRKRKKEEEIKSAIEKQKFVDLELQQEQRLLKNAAPKAKHIRATHRKKSGPFQSTVPCSRPLSEEHFERTSKCVSVRKEAVPSEVPELPAHLQNQPPESSKAVKKLDADCSEEIPQSYSSEIVTAPIIPNIYIVADHQLLPFENKSLTLELPLVITQSPENKQKKQLEEKQEKTVVSDSSKENAMVPDVFVVDGLVHSNEDHENVPSHAAGLVHSNEDHENVNSHVMSLVHSNEDHENVPSHAAGLVNSNEDHENVNSHVMGLVQSNEDHENVPSHVKSLVQSNENHENVPSHVMTSDFLDGKQLKQQLLESGKQINDTRRKIKVLLQKNRRLQKTNAELNTTIDRLRKDLESLV